MNAQKKRKERDEENKRGPPDNLEYQAIWKTIRGNRHADDFNFRAFAFCYRTRLFTTTAKYMGRGLKAIKEGDLVTLIKGLEIPVILRKEGDNYKIKGPCYVHGIMDGEKLPKDEKDWVDIVLV